MFGINAHTHGSGDENKLCTTNKSQTHSLTIERSESKFNFTEQKLDTVSRKNGVTFLYTLATLIQQAK